jgi:serine phosphatase RsbU (regulator of sigma subunit)
MRKSHGVNKRQIVHIMCSKAFLLLVVLLAAHAAGARNIRLDYIGENPLRNGKPSTDTLKFIDILRKLDWNVTITANATGHKTQYLTGRPDTITFREPASVFMTSDFEIDPSVRNTILYFGYNVTGSVQVKLNGDPLVSTGIYDSGRKSCLMQLKADDYKKILFHDTVQHIEVSYTPHPYIPNMKFALSFEQPSVAERNIKTGVRDDNEGFALGFYYLSFSIIFIILFLFFRDKKENLYFSLFCLCAAFSFLWSNIFPTLIYQGEGFLCVLALEFLSIFFARVIKNREKSKIPLAIITVVALISFHPSVAYSYEYVMGAYIPGLSVLFIILLGAYSGISSLYYLIQGIGQKRWEARAIVIIVSGAIVLFFIAPIFFVAFLNMLHPDRIGSIQYLIHYLLNIGLCIYPLSAAIVLGRRNGMNQKLLINQVKSIEALSALNLEKEREKQQLLETQNSELERKVIERTSEVQRQKELIEIKNKAITDNINYAQRIQSAILPDIKLIYKTLEQSFILFQPKDIVSGDFYAFAEKNDQVLIIAGDCTGHGVSGAFMSMIGSSLLNQIIIEKGIEEPAHILNHLNTAVIESLKQNVNESNDGMDISICSLNIKKLEMQYAGANRPLWLVRNNTLEVYKPDKFPIGGLQAARDRTFTNFKINLQKNDTIYIFTDGYADQFGGANGKKLMTSKFKEKLLSIQHMSMREQEMYLRAHFETWKGNEEQVDDVLVIGVRV